MYVYIERDVPQLSETQLVENVEFGLFDHF